MDRTAVQETPLGERERPSTATGTAGRGIAPLAPGNSTNGNLTTEHCPTRCLHRAPCTNVDTDANGVAACDLTSLPTGTHYLAIAFPGDGTYAAAGVLVSITVS